MSIQEKLAYSLDRKDQEPNKALARAIADTGDHQQLQELISLFDQKLNKRLLMDAALTIAYIGEYAPELLVKHSGFMFGQLKHPISRVSWGSMIALTHIAPLITNQLYNHLPLILDTMDGGGIVGRDHGFQLLIHLYEHEKYTEDLLHIILEQISKAPSNQLGQYTERMMAVLKPEHKLKLIEALETCREDLTNEHHLKRLSKNLKKLYK